MQKRLLQTIVLIALLCAATLVYVASLPVSQEAQFARDATNENSATFERYVKGEVKAVEEEEDVQFAGNHSLYQKVDIHTEAGEDVQIEHTDLLDAAGSVRYKVGDKLVLGVITQEGQSEYVIVDRYRLPYLWIVIGAFLVLAIVFGKLRGVTAIVGLGVTGIVLLGFIAPQILAGKNPLLVSVIGAALIVLLSMFIAHGFKSRTQLSVISTLATLLISSLLAWGAVTLTKLFGFGESDAFLLQSGFLGAIDLRGILLGGIIISVLGVLDDITTSQTAAVEELYHTNHKLSLKELYGKAISIGREHIASLINTLILVYAGSSLPLFLLFVVGSKQPLWVLFNSEYIAEELVRALVGSMALIIAVPISTILAAWYLKRKVN